MAASSLQSVISTDCVQKVKTEDQTLDAVWMPIRTGTLPRRPGGVCGQLAETQPTREPVMRVSVGCEKGSCVLGRWCHTVGNGAAWVKMSENVSWKIQNFGLVGEFALWTDRRIVPLSGSVRRVPTSAVSRF